MRLLSSFQDIESVDVFYAYRKAKADCFFERTLYASEMFAKYEESLPQNLDNLLQRIRHGNMHDLLLEKIGHPALIAKKLSTVERPETDGDRAATPSARNHSFFSDPEKAFERLESTHSLVAEFRLVGSFPVEMHILSALWINMVGHKYDARLSKSAYGSRLRRHRREPHQSKKQAADYQINAIGSFQPYFGPYKDWRESGIRAMREELTNEKSVIAISLDLQNYYHQIDPSFMTNQAFLNSVGISLNECELKFTADLVAAIGAWSKRCQLEMSLFGCSLIDNDYGGIPIGLSASKIISNALLIDLDKDINQGLAPIFYGRYVDDMFIVLRDTGNISGIEELFQYFSARTRWFPREDFDGNVRLNVPSEYIGKTVLSLQRSKQKVFFLGGHGGLDLLDTIESQIRSVSSERRLMPCPDKLDSMASAKILTAAGHPADEADRFRKADGLAVRRLAWSVQLRAIEILARDLKSDDWSEERHRFYQFAHSHILRSDRILDHIDYLPRLLSVAVSLGEWVAARKFFNSSIDAVNRLGASAALEGIKVNGLKAQNLRSVWNDLIYHLICISRQAVIASVRWDPIAGSPAAIPKEGLDFCKVLGLSREQRDIYNYALQFRESDWARTPYKYHVRFDAAKERTAAEGESQLLSAYPFEKDLFEFLKLTLEEAPSHQAKRLHDRCAMDISPKSILPYLFPTRPYTAQEIALYLPDQCVFSGKNSSAKAWARFTRALRGVWVWPRLVDGYASSEKESDGNNRRAYIGMDRTNPDVKLGITSLETSEATWELAAKGTSDCSRIRYDRIKRIVNAALTAFPRPTHLLLPEISIPERWIDGISAALQAAGINLIAGLDYHLNGPSFIHSEAVLVLADNRLGFPAAVQIRQQKVLPAPGEDMELTSKFGHTWKASRTTKPIYIHNGFHFGVLVCSELQNVGHRKSFQGSVDCLMILSWNKDLDTFSALVESASIDVHAYIALVNNRSFGDSRVRIPAKKQFLRDVCRLKGGENDHLVVVSVRTEPLRAFQSRAKRWPSNDDPYKPVPEGFELIPSRRTIPK